MAASAIADAPVPLASTAPAAESTEPSAASAPETAPAPSSTQSADPTSDFDGTVQTNNKLPTQADIDQCADLLVLDAKGESRPFKSLYSGEGVATRQLVIFVRHFFCGNCQEYLRTLSASITSEDLLTLPTPTFITVIGCGRPELIDMYIKETECPFPVYADPSRKLYDTLGMVRTLDLGPKKPEYIQKSIFSGAVSSILQGLRQGSGALKGGDIKQVGGEFLFIDGKVEWAHRMRNTRDHAEITELRTVLGLGEERTPIRKRWSTGIKELSRRSGSWGRREKKERIPEEKGEAQGGSGDHNAEEAPKGSVEEQQASEPAAANGTTA